ncbi:Serine/threonine-protein kinase [Arachis hypogaea]|uniref:Serine/threonine-protein kinase n=1 Tax=Arachis hypogaea TaxID=3818 RepID=A0A6B9V7E5_ARAHY|nr:Serine/threonine-protein kinase [Arachis hypogaea]
MSERGKKEKQTEKKERMKNIFKKLHIGSSSHDPNRSNEIQPTVPSPSCAADHRAAVASQNTGVSPASPSPSSSPSAAPSVAPSGVGGAAAAIVNRQDFFSSEEEFQVQLALAISASNSDFGGDREKDQIHAATLLSLGGHRIDSARSKDEVAEALSRQYWDYNVLDYEEKVVDGFYDVFGLSADSAMQGKMPSLRDLETDPGDSSYEVVIVNRTVDPALEELVQIAHCIALDCPVTEVGILVQRLAELVTSHMGGPVKDASIMLARWTERSTELRTSLSTSLLPIGSLNIGLSRHRALLFKVLADNIKMPCRLVKGSHYTGVEDDAVNIIKLEDEREFLVDLMAAPGTLIPADISSTKDTAFKSYNPKVVPSLPSSNEIGSSYSTPIPADEGSSQNSVIRNHSPPWNEKLYFEKPEYARPSLGFSKDVGVGPSKIPNKRNTEISPPYSGASLYKGTLGMNAVGDGTRLNVNVVPYAQNNPNDSHSLFADLNPFQIKGTGKTSVHNIPVENKAPELQSTRKNTVPGQPPVPWKNCYAYNEVSRKNNRNPNDYSPTLLVSNNSSVSEKVNLSGRKSPYSSNVNNNINVQTPPQVTGSMIAPAAIEQNWIQDLNADHNGGHVEHSQNVMSEAFKEHENSEIRDIDWRACTHDRFMGSNLKLKEPESPSSSVDSISNRPRVDPNPPMLDDVDVGECEIPWEDLVIGERIGLGNVHHLSLLLLFLLLLFLLLLLLLFVKM